MVVARHFVSVKLPVPVREALDQAVSERGIGRTAYLARPADAAHVEYHELVRASGARRPWTRRCNRHWPATFCRYGGQPQLHNAEALKRR